MDEIVSKIVPELDTYPLAAAYLFGSQAEQRSYAGSDVDIAVLFTRGTNDVDSLLTDMTYDLATALHVPETRIDVSELSALPLPLRFNIFQRGRQLLVRDESLVRDELLRTAALYHDQEPFIRSANERFAESLRS